MRKARRLYTSFRPEHYQLNLDLDPELMRFTGHLKISGQKVGRPAERLTLHQKGLKITSAKLIRHDKKTSRQLEIKRLNHHASLDEIRLHATELLYPGNYTVELEFSGPIQTSMHGLYASTYEHEGQKKKIISTDLESHHAREIFPCIDEPEAKATFDLTVKLPEQKTVLSNTPIVSQEQADKQVITKFAKTPKMSTYLFAFVWGDLHCREAETQDGVKIRSWATPNHPLAALDFSVEVARRAIEFFNDYYNLPYPLEKCDLVAIPNFSAAAMENWGLITFREMALLVDPKTTSQSAREMVATVICHELAHQWFGNLVTMRWWDDLWLNESFANVMEYVAVDHLFPEWNVWNDFTTQEGLSSQRRDSIAGVQAVKTKVNHPDEIGSLFDPSIVYAKGGRLLNMLMKYIGEEDFRQGLTSYFTTHAYSNTTGDDLWAALSSASGKPIKEFMDPWLNQSGFPMVVVDQKDDKLTITQAHFQLKRGKASDQLWPVPLLSSTPALPELLPSAKLTLKLPNKEFVRIDEGAVGHYIVHYKNPAHADYVACLAEAKTLQPSERLILLSDSSMLARAGKVSFADTLGLLKHYSQEDSEPVWDMMSLIIGDLKRFVDISPSLEVKIKAMVRKLISQQFKRLGWQEQKQESSQDTKLRATIIGLGVYSEHAEILDHALDLFEKYKTKPQIVPSELRAIVFGAAVRHQHADAFNYLLDLEEATTNVDLKHDLLAALSLTEKPYQIKKLLDRLKDTDKVRAHDVDNWLVSLLRSRKARPEAWDWLRDNWGWIEETFADDKSYDYFPRYAAIAFNTRQLLREYRLFFEPKADQTALKRNIAMGIEEISTRVNWLERDETPVKNFFKGSSRPL